LSEAATKSRQFVPVELYKGRSASYFESTTLLWIISLDFLLNAPRNTRYTMTHVAIAGGTSKGLGRSLTKAIIAAYPDGKWKPIILSRTDKVPNWASQLLASSFEIRTVDYSSPSSLDAALNDCHTVLSVIQDEGGKTSNQILLLNAAVRVGVKRFVPSEWSIGPVGSKQLTLFAAAKPAVWEACENSGIEWSRFNVGVFMNYLGIGCSGDKEFEEAACAGVDRSGDMPAGDGSFLFSMASATAEIPLKADGSYPRYWITEINNIGEFVAAALELQKWERDMNIVGSVIRLDDLLKLAEDVRGKKFEVAKLEKEGLQKEIATLGPEDFIKQLWVEAKLLIAGDTDGESVLEPNVNKLCPEVKVMDVETYLTKHWSG
jgi:hypothetical protein